MPTSPSEVPRPEYPRPLLCRPAWMNLNGLWQFAEDPGASGLERRLYEAPLPERIRVPFARESRLSGIGRQDFVPAVWYRRSFLLPEAWAGRRLLLHFGAVDYEARVWVNGRLAGAHRGGYTPFTVEITGLVGPGRNTAAVCALDDTRSPLQAVGKQSQRFASYGCHYTRTTGIWQTVWLEPVPATYLRGIRYHPAVSSGLVLVDASVDGDRAGLAVRVVVRAGRRIVGSSQVACQWLTRVPVRLTDVRCWSPEDPFLYDVEVLLVRGRRIVDRVTSYLGLRTVELEGHRFLLNGRPRFLRLVLDQGFHPDGIYTAPDDEALQRDIRLAQALGFNGARLHMKVFEPRFLYWADRLGYLVWAEFPNWGYDVNNPLAGQRHLAEWAEVLQRDWNHPSIIGWCPLNETHASSTEAAFLLHENLYHFTRAVDPSRPCIDTSGYNHRVTDIYDVHDYCQDVEEFRRHYAPLAEGRTGPEVYYNRVEQAGQALNPPYAGGPYFVSEFGGIWWDPHGRVKDGWGYGGPAGRPRTAAEFLARYRGLVETLLTNPRVCGFCYTQLYDVEQEVNGLATYDRRPKFAPKVIRAINQQPAAIEQV